MGYAITGCASLTVWSLTAWAEPVTMSHQQATLPQVTAIAPPVAYPSNTWQGKGEAVLRVLDKLESQVEVLTIPINTIRRYKNLIITVGRCLQRPPTLPPDAAAWLDIQDTLHNGRVFHGWMLAAEPSLGILEDPLYDVQVIRCDGNDLPPILPPLPKPVVPPLPGVSLSPPVIPKKTPIPAVVQTGKTSSSIVTPVKDMKEGHSFPEHTQPLSLPAPKRQDAEEMHSVLSPGSSLGGTKNAPLPPPVPFSTPLRGPEKGGIY